MVTSGLGQRFPYGYPVGKVVKVKRNQGDEFATVTLKPSAHIYRSRLMLLVWPMPQQFKQPLKQVVHKIKGHRNAKA